MSARLLAKAAGIGGELVPESIEVYPLPASDQTLHVWAAETEMPQQRVLEDFLPRAHARQRGVDEDKARHAVAMLRGEGVTHHVADVVGHQRCGFDVKRVQYAGNVAALRFLS